MCARLKYRYLDLRNPEVKNNIILRCQVVAALRKAMLDHGFLEIRLGAGCTPGLHARNMTFDTAQLSKGVKVLVAMALKKLG